MMLLVILQVLAVCLVQCQNTAPSHNQTEAGASLSTTTTSLPTLSSTVPTTSSRTPSVTTTTTTTTTPTTTTTTTPTTTYLSGDTECWFRADVAILVDLSGTSVSLWNYEFRPFVKDIISRLDVKYDGVRVGVLTSSPSAQVQFYLDRFTSKRDLTYSIDTLPKPEGETLAAETLLLMRNDLFSQRHDKRPDVPNVAIMITDGTSLISNEQAQRQLRDAADAGIKLWVLMIQSGYSTIKNLLRLVTFDGDVTTVATDLDAVLEFVNMNAPKVCVPVTTTTTPRPTVAVIQNLTCADTPCYGPRSCGLQSLNKDDVMSCTCPTNSSDFVAKYCPQSEPKRPSHYQCKLLVNRNDTSQNSPGSKCGIEIYTLCPTMGPEGGGTDVIMWGDDLDRVTKIVFTMFPCNITFRNSTLIQCRSGSILGTNSVRSLLQMDVSVGACKAVYMGSFVYSHTPWITGLQPTTFMDRGGQQLTVNGANLDSVRHPIMTVSVVRQGTTEVYTKLCSIPDRKTMLCETPDITAPPDVTLPGATKRSRRETRSQQNIQVHLGFELDGLPNYRNVSRALPKLAPIQLCGPPDVYYFTEHDRAKAINTGWPDYQRDITIVGSGLLNCVQAQEFRVRVGSSACLVREVNDTYIVCRPPRTKPSNQNDMEVIVSVGNVEVTVGRLRYAASFWGGPDAYYAFIVIMVVICVIIVTVALYCLIKRYCGNKHKKKKKPAPTYGADHSNLFLVGDYLDPRAKLLDALDAGLREKVTAHLIPNERIKQEQIIKKGNLGIMWSGHLLDQKKTEIEPIIVRTFKDKGAPFREISAFLEQATLLRGCQHKNLLRLVGVVIHNSIPKVVTPLAENGTLKEYLLAHKDENSPSFSQLLQFAVDATDGMLVLADKDIVHEDLAARNCVLGDKLTLQISDGALSRDLYEDEYYRAGEKLRPLPVKWMPPESMETGAFTTKSDVWSFGVLIWEILTLGEMPYTEVANANMKEYLKEGHRLRKPDTCPVKLYTFMTHCWAKDPNKRPIFHSAIVTLGGLLQAEGTASNGHTLANGHSHENGEPTQTDSLPQNKHFIKNNKKKAQSSGHYIQKGDSLERNAYLNNGYTPDVAHTAVDIDGTDGESVSGIEPKEDHHNDSHSMDETPNDLPQDDTDSRIHVDIDSVQDHHVHADDDDSQDPHAHAINDNGAEDVPDTDSHARDSQSVSEEAVSVRMPLEVDSSGMGLSGQSEVKMEHGTIEHPSEEVADHTTAF